jgi:hypothetical protein
VHALRVQLIVGSLTIAKRLLRHRHCYRREGSLLSALRFGFVSLDDVTALVRLSQLIIKRHNYPVHNMQAVYVCVCVCARVLRLRFRQIVTSRSWDRT